MCFKIYKLDARQAAFEKTKVKLHLLTVIGMLLMVEKGILLIILFIDLQKLIKNTRKIMIKLKNRHIFNIEV